jgi:hypothetical protein
MAGMAARRAAASRTVARCVPVLAAGAGWPAPVRVTMGAGAVRCLASSTASPGYPSRSLPTNTVVTRAQQRTLSPCPVPPTRPSPRCLGMPLPLPHTLCLSLSASLCILSVPLTLPHTLCLSLSASLSILGVPLPLPHTLCLSLSASLSILGVPLTLPHTLCLSLSASLSILGVPLPLLHTPCLSLSLCLFPYTALGHQVCATARGVDCRALWPLSPHSAAGTQRAFPVH